MGKWPPPSRTAENENQMGKSEEKRVEKPVNQKIKDPTSDGCRFSEKERYLFKFKKNTEIFISSSLLGFKE